MKRTTITLLILAWATFARGQGYNGGEIPDRHDCTMCNFEYVGQFENGFAQVTKHGKHGIINEKLKETVPCVYDERIVFSSNGLAIVAKDNKYTIIDTNGKRVNTLEYEKYDCTQLPIEYCNIDNHLVVKYNGKYGVLEKNGRFRIPPTYEYMTSIIGARTLYYAGDGNGVGIVDDTGRVVVPLKYCGLGEYFIDDCILVLGSNGKWGLLDTAGKEILPCAYDKDDLWDSRPSFKVYDRRLLLLGSPLIDTNHNHFVAILKDTTETDVLSRVKVTSYWGIINGKGKFIVPPVYDTITKLVNGYAKVKLAYNWGYINEKGNLTIPCDFNRMGDAYKGIVSAGRYYQMGLRTVENQEILYEKYRNIYPFYNDTACVLESGGLGIIDTHGNELISPYSHTSHVDSVINNFINRLPNTPEYERLKHERNRIQDKTQTTTTKPANSYNHLSKFSEGVAILQNKNGLHGVINKLGNVIVPCIYQQIGTCSDGRMLVRIDEKYGYIDKTGSLKIPIKYNEANKFSEGLACVAVNGRYGYIDTNGKQVIPCKYEMAKGFNENLAAICVNGKWGFIDKHNKVIIPAMYESANSFSDGLATVKINGKAGCIDKKGKLVIPCLYDNVSDFKCGAAFVKSDSKWGAIDFTGKEIAPIIYDYVVGFCDSLGTLRYDGEEINHSKHAYKVINTQGKEVKFDTIFKYVYPLSNGLFLATYHNKTNAIIDKNGKILMEIDFGKISECSDGVVVVRSHKKKWGYINKSCKEGIFWLVDGNYSTTDNYITTGHQLLNWSRWEESD